MLLLDASAVQSFIALLYDPNVVFLLFVVGMLGLYLEISHPGVSIPGIVGAIALVVFLFAASELTPNWSGLVLMVLAFVLLVLDLRFLAHGVLSIGAVFALIAGTMIFFQGSGVHTGKSIEPLLVYAVGIGIGLIGIVLVGYIARVRRLRVTTGVEGMIGETATVLTELQPLGRVSYAGENWEALLDTPFTELAAGTKVQIVAVEGLRLRVRPSGQILPERHPGHDLHVNKLNACE
jgi:membrane-bound serine protease (ClpP class)